jgi:hypothetical protein
MEKLASYDPETAPASGAVLSSEYSTIVEIFNQKCISAYKILQNQHILLDTLQTQH